MSQKAEAGENGGLEERIQTHLPSWQLGWIDRRNEERGVQRKALADLAFIRYCPFTDIF